MDLIQNYCPQSVLLGLFHLPSSEEFLPGGLASNSRLELPPAGSSPPNVDGPASAAIWANYQVSGNSGDLPKSPNIAVSSTLLSSSLQWGLLVLPLELGSPPVLGVLVPPHVPPPLFVLGGSFFLSLFSASSLFLPCLNLKRESAIGSQSRLMSHMAYNLNF